MTSYDNVPCVCSAPSRAEDHEVPPGPSTPRCRSLLCSAEVCSQGLCAPVAHWGGRAGGTAGEHGRSGVRVRAFVLLPLAAGARRAVCCLPVSKSARKMGVGGKLKHMWRGHDGRKRQCGSKLINCPLFTCFYCLHLFSWVCFLCKLCICLYCGLGNCSEMSFSWSLFPSRAGHPGGKLLLWVS